MLYFVVAALAPGTRVRVLVAAAGLIAVGVELLRLCHFPGFDAFRRTLMGALLLGRIFSPWNILAYWLGIGLGGVADRLLLRRRSIPETRAGP